jgi:outer membrane cobalamin receptor
MLAFLHRPAHAFTVLSIAWMYGCHTARPAPIDDTSLPPPTPEGRLITADEIARAHVSDAWELLQRAGAFIQQERADGMPARLQSRRGPTSIMLKDADAPVIVVDGVRIGDLEMLRHISADAISRVRILNGHDGTTYYGTNAGAGVIIIETKRGPHDGPAA